MLRIAIVGASGQMGMRLMDVCASDPEVEVVAALAHPSDPRIGQPAPCGGCPLILSAETDTAFDALIDFSRPEGTLHWLEHCARAGLAMVSGTTGLTHDQMTALRVAGRRIPVLWSANFSLGMNLLMRLAPQVALELGRRFNVEIVETHHNHKVDAPSGTALELADAVTKATGGNLERDAVYGRHGQLGPRSKREIGIHAIRLGDQAGRHEVHFGGPSETVVLTHVVHSRDTFAHGAVRAVKWLSRQQPGWYTMADVLESAPTR
ncbi:MAG: 4-hydroxy-tetrahydrodipicolinate reductase [Phycisphaerae bacterium]